MSDSTPPPRDPLPPPPLGAQPAEAREHARIDVPSPSVSRARQPGRLDATWRALTVTTWVGVFVAYLAVWKASEEIGLSTWWLGARSDPQPLLIQLVPFFVAAVFGSLAGYNVRRLPWITMAGSVVLAAIAAPDLSRSAGLATVEFAIAGAVLVVALASFTGTYRAPTAHLDR